MEPLGTFRKHILLDCSPVCPVPMVTPDSTLSKTDLILESSLSLLKHNPLHVPVAPLRFLKEKAYLKPRIAR